MPPLPLLRPLLLALILHLGGTQLRAEHFMGGSLTYECLGGNNFRITYDMYLDCSGVAAQPQTLHFFNSCGVSFSIGNLLPVEVIEISPLCAAQIPNSTCNGGALPGIMLYRFQYDIYLSPCDHWTIAAAPCCRNPTTVNILYEPGFFIEATLNNLNGICDDSPQFANPGIPYVCL
ncbi:MAG: hypothetical protein RBT71_03780, partial [Flavobacteriales bacterium]|nr:hypothetical protein [Flavobacteriales bacterium]